MMKKLGILGLAAGLALATSAPAIALSNNAKSANAAWRKSDICSKKAFEIFPDYTPEHIAKRDAYVRKCLVENKLPSQGALGSKQ